MKKKRPIADRKYKEVNNFICDIFNKKYSNTIFDKDIILDDGKVIKFIFNHKLTFGKYDTYYPAIFINGICYSYHDDRLSKIPTKDLHSIYKTIHNSLDSILFQVYL